MKVIWTIGKNVTTWVEGSSEDINIISDLDQTDKYVIEGDLMNPERIRKKDEAYLWKPSALKEVNGSFVVKEWERI